MLLQKFRELIHVDFILSQEAGYWKVIETAPSALNKEVEIGGCKSFGFSLDKDGVEPWAFIKPNTTLAGMKQVCDSVVIAHDEDNDYIIAMDLKSTRSGSARKQIRSTKILVDWIIELMRQHNHWNGNYKFIGIINKVGRSQPKKRTSRRSNSVLVSQVEGEICFFELTDVKRVQLKEIISNL